MPKLDTLTLRVMNPEEQRKFYIDVLGMSDRGDGRVAFSQEEMAIRFVAAKEPYVHVPTDIYWKIALSVPNIDLAYDQLKRSGIDCSEPKQFRDVGYLAKFTDPEGFAVELIDHWFKGDRPDEAYNENLLGGGVHLSLVTLRTGDIAAIEPDILSWGMTPLSVQPVEPYGFTLYFYGFTNETPPDKNLQAVENRTWVYQRPYTVLEIQHVHSLKAESRPVQAASGYGGLTINSAGFTAVSERLGIELKA